MHTERRGGETLASKKKGGNELNWILQQHWNERFNLQNLGSFFHDNIVKLEAKLDEIVSLCGEI